MLQNKLENMKDKYYKLKKLVARCLQKKYLWYSKINMKSF